MTLTCAHCGKPLAAKPTGRPGRYCSGACRAAASRDDAAKEARVEQVPATPYETPQRGSYRGPLCPIDPRHGRLYDWPTDRWAFHCPHQEHDPLGDRRATRAFFTTVEAERGSIAPALGAGPDLGRLHGGGLDQGLVLRQAPEPHPAAVYEQPGESGRYPETPSEPGQTLPLFGG
jgi:hypothetical protein